MGLIYGTKILLFGDWDTDLNKIIKIHINRYDVEK